MNGADHSPVVGKSSGMDYKTDRPSYDSELGCLEFSSRGIGASLSAVNEVNEQTVKQSAKESECLKFGTFPKRFVNQSSELSGANLTECAEQTDTDNVTSEYSNFTNQFMKPAYTVDSSDVMPDSDRQMVPRDFKKESKVLALNNCPGQFDSQSSEVNINTETDEPVNIQHSPENETLKFCAFVKQCTKRSKGVDSINLKENERQSENKGRPSIRANDIVSKPSRDANSSPLYSSESERRSVSEQDSSENDTLKFGTFPKQIKVYKKCQINSLSSPEHSTASLDRGMRQPVRGMRLFSDSSYDGRAGNSTRGRASVSDFYRHSRREIINTTARVEENECLREIIEDLRSSLQRRDAQCLALHVALQHAQSAYNSKRLTEEHYMRREPFVSVLYEEVSEDTDPNVQARLSSPNQADNTTYNNYREDETNSSKNSEIGDKEFLPSPPYSQPQSVALNERGQVELLEHLKYELYKMSRDKSILEDHNKTLVDTLETLNGNYSMTRRMFEVALAKVRDLEREVAVVPYLQEKIAQYEGQAEVKPRPEKGKAPRPKSSTLEGVLGFIRRTRHRSTSEDRHSPMGSSQNSVQSQAESINSANTLEKERKQKRLSWRGSRTSSNTVESGTVSQLQETFASLNSRFTRVSEEKRQLFDELQCCKLRNNECRKELENIGADLTRLTKLEEKIQDTVVFLHILRRKYLSRRTLGKFLFDVLDECPESPRDDVIAERFVEGLVKKLSESELLKEESYQRVPVSRRPSHTSSEDTLTAKERETLCFL